MATQKTDYKIGAVFSSEMIWVQNEALVKECDLLLEYWIHDLESMKSLGFDPHWTQMVYVDGSDWLDMSRSVTRISYDPTTYLKHQSVMTRAGSKRRRRGRFTASPD